MTPQEISDLVGAIMANKSELGLVWSITPGTVTSNADPLAPLVLVDSPNATESIPVIPVNGLAPADSRVWVVSTPGGGNYMLVRTRHRVATTYVTADVTGIVGAETPVALLGPYQEVAGRAYRVEGSMTIGSSVANDTANIYIRDSDSTGTLGTQLNVKPALIIPVVSGAGVGMPAVVYEYVATETRERYISFSAIRLTGTGTLRLEAGSDHPAIFIADYVYG